MAALTPGESPDGASSHARSASHRSARVLACVQCHQRKLKCSRTFPCSNCLKSASHCIPASALPARPRRKRFPEKELLDRLRHYESLLSENNVPFEPLHPSSYRDATPPSTLPPSSDRPPAERPSSEHLPVIKSEPDLEAKDFWDAMYQKRDDPSDDDDGEAEVVENAMRTLWDKMVLHSDHLGLLGAHHPHLDLTALHPSPVDIFKLWQLYLDNVNPILKVIHTPTLQPRIIDAVAHLSDLDPTLEALMFGIYCVAILSLEDHECRRLFHADAKDCTVRFQFGCQQALQRCNILRCRDRDGLTALHLFLMSTRTDVDPHSLSSMLGVAMRIAHRLGIHNESANARCTILEAEMRRRLWWSFILFDARISEMSEYKNAMLGPLWNCKVPLNVNDHDLRPELEAPPAYLGCHSEALFAVVRAEMANYVRHCSYHLDFINPALKQVSPRAPPDDGSSEVAGLEELIESKYLAHLNLSHPLHFLTTWTARAYLAKNKLIEHFSKFGHASVPPTDAQRNESVEFALTMLDCDQRLMTSPLAKAFIWQNLLHWPFPAYMHLVKELRRAPQVLDLPTIWAKMSDHYVARDMHKNEHGRRGHGPPNASNPFYRMFSQLALSSWQSCAPYWRGDEPLIVRDMKQKNAMALPASTAPSLSDGVGSHTPASWPSTDDDMHHLLNNYGGFLENDESLFGGLMGSAPPPPDGMDLDLSGFNLGGAEAREWPSMAPPVRPAY